MYIYFTFGLTSAAGTSISDVQVYVTVQNLLPVQHKKTVNIVATSKWCTTSPLRASYTKMLCDEGKVICIIHKCMQAKYLFNGQVGVKSSDYCHLSHLFKILTDSLTHCSFLEEWPVSQSFGQGMNKHINNHSCTAPNPAVSMLITLSGNAYRNSKSTYSSIT